MQLSNDGSLVMLAGVEDGLLHCFDTWAAVSIIFSFQGALVWWSPQRV